MSDEQLAGAAEIPTELSKVNSGSPREKELSRQLEDLYRRQYGEPGAPTPRPDGYEGQSTPTPRPDALAPDEAAIAGMNARALRLDQLRAEREQFGNTTERNRVLDLEIEDLLRSDWEAEKSYAPEPVSPSTLTFQDGTEESVKNAFAAVANEYDVPQPEAQAVLDSLKDARWLTPEQFRAEMVAEWGEHYAALAALADRTLELLPFTLQKEVKRYEANDTRFSPEVARALVAWAKRRRSGPR